MDFHIVASDFQRILTGFRGAVKKILGWISYCTSARVQEETGETFAQSIVIKLIHSVVN